MDPLTEDNYAYLDIADFEERWHDIVDDQNTHAQHPVIFVAGTSMPPTPQYPTNTSTSYEE
jgi:hypothetical protein